MTRKKQPKADDDEDYWEQGSELLGTIQQLTDPPEGAPLLKKRKRRTIGFCRDLDEEINDEEEAKS